MALAAERGDTAALAVATAVAVLLVAQTGIAVAARDAELGYFNLLAGRDPAAVLLDSDLDWGQDLFVLRREARARGIDDAWRSPTSERCASASTTCPA